MPNSPSRAVAVILSKLVNLPPSPGAGRVHSFCEPGENQAVGALENSNHVLRILLEDLECVLSAELLVDLPSVTVEQFCLQTVLSNDGGSQLIARLVEAFISAYARPETHADALRMLNDLEDIADNR